jgi:hypothetical protein
LRPRRIKSPGVYALPPASAPAPNNVVCSEPPDRPAALPPACDGDLVDASQLAVRAELRRLAHELAEAFEAVARMTPCHARMPHPPHLH